MDPMHAPPARHDRRRFGRVAVLVVVASLITVALATAAAAQESELGGKLRSGPDVVVPADETVPDDLYASGGSVRIAGTVEGDLVVAAGQVSVTGQVDGDVVVTGGSLSISGEVDGDVRAAGGQLDVDGAVGEDLFFAGGQAAVGSSGTVGGDLVFSVGRMDLDGEVAGDVLGGAGEYTSDGVVGGSERVTVADADREVSPTITERVIAAVRRYGALLVVGALLLWLIPWLVGRAATRLVGRPLPSLGMGFAGMFGFVAAVFALVVVGILLAVAVGLLGLGSLAATVAVATMVAVAVLAFAFAVMVVFAADVVVALVLGRFAIRRAPEAPRPQQLAALAVGLLPVVALTALPVVGGWIRLLVVLLGLGGMLLWRRSARRLPPEEAAGEPARA